MTKSVKTIGILAGMGPRSTAPFLSLVLDECQKQYGAKHDDEFPPIMIYSLPTLFYIDKPVDQKKLKEVVCDGVKHLESTGVDFIVIPCSTIHAFFEEIQASVHVPVLNMITESMTQIPDEVTSVGLMATRMTNEAGLYQDALKRVGKTVVEVTDLQERVDELILAIKTNVPKEELMTRFHHLVGELKIRGAQAILVACTDLSELAKSSQDLPVFDAVAGLAQSTVRQYLG